MIEYKRSIQSEHTNLQNTDIKEFRTSIDVPQKACETQKDSSKVMQLDYELGSHLAQQMEQS
jgi:hypothetical protein